MLVEMPIEEMIGEALADIVTCQGRVKYTGMYAVGNCAFVKLSDRSE